MTAETLVDRTELEIESKYDVDDDTELPSLDLLPGVAACLTARPVALEAVYYDTPSRQLLRSGITLRRRAGGHDEGWHLKLPTDGGRYETRLPLTNDGPPETLVHVLLGVIRDAVIQPVATISTTRTVTSLIDADQRVLAVACDDRVLASALESGEVQAWREWELELKHGGSDLAAAGTRALLAAGAAPAHTGSKLGRILREPTASETVQDGAAVSAADLVRPQVAAQVARLRRLDPLARADLPDSIHQMRVACRRLRALLGSFGMLFDEPGSPSLRSELGWLTRVLGRPRDLEVESGHIVRHIVDGAERRRVAASITSAHERAHHEAIAVMSSSRYFALVDALTLLTARTWTQRADRAEALDLREPLQAELRRVERRRRQAKHSKPGRVRDARLHSVRKAARRARYTAEAIEPILGENAHALIQDLADAQDALGVHHDLVVAYAEAARLTGTDDDAVPGVLRTLHAETRRHDKLVRHSLDRLHHDIRRLGFI